MEIYLIRHTSPDIPAGICYGQSDIDVAPSFEGEAKLVLSELSQFIDIPSTPCYSSPLRRCLKLAETLPFNDVQVDDRLKELDFGHWELQPWDQIDRDALDHWGEDFVNVTVPGGESFLDLYARVEAFVSYLKSLKLKRIAIVTHAGVIRSFYSYSQSKPLETSFDLKVNYGDVVQLRITNSEAGD